MGISIIEGIILGIVQGATEFFPISSSGHLAIIQNIFNLKIPVAFDVALHIGTLIVIFIVFFKDIIKIIKDFFTFNFKTREGKLALYIILASIITAIIGFSFRNLFKSFFYNLSIISLALIFTGLILLLTKLKKSQKKRINWFDSLLIGAAQGIALIPGISRSGATISTGKFLGIKKQELIKFSFIVSIPSIIGAMIFEFKELSFKINFLPIIFGVITSIIIGYIALKLLIRIIKKNKFHYFAYYCLTLGLALLICSVLI